VRNNIDDNIKYKRIGKNGIQCVAYSISFQHHTLYVFIYNIIYSFDWWNIRDLGMGDKAYFHHLSHIIMDPKPAKRLKINTMSSLCVDNNNSERKFCCNNNISEYYATKHTTCVDLVNYSAASLYIMRENEDQNRKVWWCHILCITFADNSSSLDNEETTLYEIVEEMDGKILLS